MTLGPGTTLGPYQIVSQLGSGGMGVVYQARDPRLDRHVAIKLLPPDLTRDETSKQRFLQEAKAASALDHPNICTIHEINETADGQLYLVMAHYEGETLKERISRGPLELDDAIDISTQVGEGLTEAHRAGIVHRDIKPANLLVTKSGVVKILDFGLAKLAGSEGVTQTGTTVGTVAYMSPEQAQGWEVDHRTDIWSLGVVLYEMLAGEPPFQGENLLSLADAIRSSEPETVSGGSSQGEDVSGVYVLSLPDGGNRRLIANNGNQPQWRADGRELFYIEFRPTTGGVGVMSVPVEATAEGFSHGTPTELFSIQAGVQGVRNVYVASRDGQRFLVNRLLADDPASLTWATDWLAERIAVRLAR